jgi:hypothetical protein
MTNTNDQVTVREIISSAVPLPRPIALVSPTLVGPWHMLEQSGKLLLPYSRANSWYKKTRLHWRYARV